MFAIAIDRIRHFSASMSVCRRLRVLPNPSFSHLQQCFAPIDAITMLLPLRLSVLRTTPTRAFNLSRTAAIFEHQSDELCWCWCRAGGSGKWKQSVSQAKGVKNDFVIKSYVFETLSLCCNRNTKEAPLGNFLFESSRPGNKNNCDCFIASHLASNTEGLRHKARNNLSERHSHSEERASSRLQCRGRQKSFSFFCCVSKKGTGGRSE